MILWGSGRWRDGRTTLGGMRVLPAGPDALLLDFGSDDDPAAAGEHAWRALSEALAAGALPTITDLVPGAHTLLVQAESGSGVDDLGVRRALRTATAATGRAAEPDTVTIPVVYDGADLDAVAALIGTGPGEVADIHRRTLWQVRFMGFAPGFAYLTPTAGSSDGPHPFHRIGRRPESRPRVPAGSVAIAAGYSAVYPRQSPGGWYLLGRTGVRLWDETADRPALLAPGTLVRFAAEGDRR